MAGVELGRAGINHVVERCPLPRPLSLATRIDLEEQLCNLVAVQIDAQIWPQLAAEFVYV